MKNYRLKPSARRLRRRWFIAFVSVLFIAWIILWLYPHPLNSFDFFVGFLIGGGIAGAITVITAPAMMAKGESIDGYVAGYAAAAAVKRHDEEQ